ncbi:MAG: hypothetical protein BWY88_01074 [Synergistetes bacterium ADurb.Bin520]|nr:MAG: hypothetical protein BWY88_01074 [Synergistetes bacterium ADurb.Bin520]
MVQVAVDVAVGKKPDEMQRPSRSPDVGDEFFPGFPGEKGPGLDGAAHQLRALGEDPPAADGVVPHLAVSHVLVRGKAHRGAVGLHLHVRARPVQGVQGSGHGLTHRVAFGIGPVAYSVQYGEDHRTPAAFEFRILFQRFHACTLPGRRIAPWGVVFPGLRAPGKPEPIIEESLRSEKKGDPGPDARAQAAPFPAPDGKPGRRGQTGPHDRVRPPGGARPFRE